MKEETLTVQILHYLRDLGLPAWRTHDTRHHPVEPGIADINAVLPNGRFLAIEVKAEGGKTNKLREQQQTQWLESVGKSNAVVCRVDSLLAAQRIIDRTQMGLE
jgi:hypothetical protein